MSETKFLDALATAEHTAGVYLFRSFLTKAEANDLFASLDDDSIFPWDMKPVLYGERLTQHAYLFSRKPKQIEAWPGLAELEALCGRVEAALDCTVVDVFCNRFQDTAHRLPWHTDTYGHHIAVLSLGAGRNVQFRRKSWINTKPIETVRPAAGDMYFMPLKLNDTHEHRVCPAESGAEGTRLSFVFFLKTPNYAKEFKITTRQKIQGAIEAVLEKVM
eukprot:jgi/Ulvmu1/6560/UM003_0197.1